MFLNVYTFSSLEIDIYKKKVLIIIRTPLCSFSLQLYALVPYLEASLDHLGVCHFLALFLPVLFSMHKNASLTCFPLCLLIE